MEKVFLRTPFNYDRDAVSEETGFVSVGESLTEQSHTKSCDPNFIMDRHRKGEDITFNVTRRQPMYGDFSAAPASYHEALNFVKQAEMDFMELDAHIRSKFDNDPGKFLEWVADPDNAKQIAELGLMTPEATARVLKTAEASNASQGSPPAGDDGTASSEPAKRGKRGKPEGSGEE